MAHIKEIEIGKVESLNNLTMFRKVGNLPFLPHYYFDEEDNMIIEQSKVVVNYIQYYKNDNGDIVEKLTETRTYEVQGSKATNWFLNLARTPISNLNGILDEIEYTLSKLPINIPNQFILK